MRQGAEPQSTHRRFVLLAALLIAAGAAIRLWNALRFPLLTSYDGFAHFTYVWFVATTWKVPRPTAGWEFFQPPLYYAWMAAVWRAFAGLDAVLRLHAGVAVVALASLAHAGVAWDVVRRRLPDDRVVQALVLAFMLFLPVHLYAAGFLGNEGLAAVLCTLAFAVLLAELRRPSIGRSAALGVLLGLALLTKITALAVVAGAVATLALKGVVTGRDRAAVVHLAVLLAVLVGTSGWYYARNVAEFGTPFVMSRRELMLRIIEDSQPQAQRSVAEYLLFDPVVFRRPMWPRGLDVPDPPRGWSRAVRDAVWTGLYANTWFDGFGGWTVPRVTGSEGARRAGQSLLTLGVLPTAAVVIGFLASLAALRRGAWDDVRVATGLTIVPMLIIFVVGTRAVPIAAAVKATYLLPVTAAFGVAFGLGLERIRPYRRAFAAVATSLALASLISAAVFTHGLLFDAREIRGAWPLTEASMANQYGVVHYAGGDRAAARARFEVAAADGLYLGWENLALLAFEAGQPEAALHALKRAIRLQPAQSPGLPDDRALYDRITSAEYLNLVAVFEQQRGRDARVERAAMAAISRDATLPEAHFNLAVGILARRETPTNAVALRRAQRHLARAAELDAGFLEARALAAIVATVARGCAVGAPASLVMAAAAPGDRRYPVETGIGAPYAASIGRRRHIAAVPTWLGTTTCGRVAMPSGGTRAVR